MCLFGGAARCILLWVPFHIGARAFPQYPSASLHSSSSHYLHGDRDSLHHPVKKVKILLILFLFHCTLASIHSPTASAKKDWACLHHTYTRFFNMRLYSSVTQKQRSVAYRQRIHQIQLIDFIHSYIRSHRRPCSMVILRLTSDPGLRGMTIATTTASCMLSQYAPHIT